MFNNWEALRCIRCDDAFTGRKPPENVDILCLKCLSINDLPIINENDTVSDNIDNFVGGRDNE